MVPRGFANLAIGPLARGGSARRLAATRAVNLFLESIEADGADDDILAYDVARRTVEAERFGELEAFLDRGLHLVACHVLLDLRDVEADLLRRRERARLVGLATAAEQLLVKLEIFLAGLVLHAHGRRYLRRLHRAVPQHWKLLEYELELAVVLDELEHVAHGALAVAAIVIEELDHGDVALGIAQRHLPRRGEDGGAVVGDGGTMLFRLRLRLPLLELVHDLLQELRMAHQVVLDDALDLAALLAGEGLRARGRRGRHGHEERKQRGSEWAGRKFHRRLSFVIGGGTRSAVASSWRDRRL